MDLSDAQLLEREVDAVFGLRAGPGKFPLLVKPDIKAVVAWSPQALLLAVSPEVKLDESSVDLDEPYIAGAVPRVIAALAWRLRRRDTNAADAPAAVTGGPTFVIPPEVAAPAVDLPVVVSDDSGMTRAASFERPANWEEDDWRDLTQGRIGEWAMALHDDEPVSICHSPAATKDVAEAGVWTRADFRGRGLAPATLVAWARQERNNKQVLFYSTGTDNSQSLAVARKLRLTPLGWMWIIR
jgi:RimJ/RimL family protein N-acetyltransferase